MFRAYRLLAPGLVGVALASTAAAAPAKSPKPQAASKDDQTRPAGKDDQGDQSKPASKDDKSKPAGKDDKSAKPDEAKDAGDQDKQKGAESAAGEKPEAEPSTKAESAAEPPSESEKETPPPPPPAPPRASEQKPHPYLQLPEPETPSRKVELGPHAGVEYLPASGSAVSYGPGFAWGAHARILIAPWMGFRVSFTQSSQSVSIPDGGLGLPAGTSIDQPNLSVLLLRARIEPTWVVSPRFRLWAGVGAGWGRISAEALTTTGAEAGLHSAIRKGVMLEFAGELGASFDVIPNWLAASLLVSGGALTNQSGEVFTPSQAFTANGHRIYVEGLPHFGGSLSALLGVGVLL